MLKTTLQTAELPGTFGRRHINHAIRRRLAVTFDSPFILQDRHRFDLRFIQSLYLGNCDSSAIEQEEHRTQIVTGNHERIVRCSNFGNPHLALPVHRSITGLNRTERRSLRYGCDDRFTCTGLPGLFFGLFRSITSRHKNRSDTGGIPVTLD